MKIRDISLDASVYFICCFRNNPDAICLRFQARAVARSLQEDRQHDDKLHIALNSRSALVDKVECFFDVMLQTTVANI
jgi:hypothetical protein